MDVPKIKEKSMTKLTKKNLTRQFTMFFNKNGKYVRITSYKAVPHSFDKEIEKLWLN